MAFSFRRFLKGIRLIPNSTTEVASAGDIDFATDTNKLALHNGTTASPVVTESHTATLTNKVLTGNTAVNLVSGSGTLTLNTSGTAVVPNGGNLVNELGTATLGNKTLTSPVINGGIYDLEIMTEQGSTPANPGAGFRKLYVKTDGKAYLLNSSGTESQLIDGASGVASVSNGGTGQSSLTANNVILGNGTSAVQVVAPSTSGNVLTSNGTTWVSSASATSPTSIDELSNLGLAISQSTGTITVALKQSDGSTDPASGTGAVKVGFRGATATNGDYNQRSITSALSLSLAGATTLGAKSGVSVEVYVYLFDNSGTITLGASLNRYNQFELQSSSTTATSSSVIYQASALASKPIRLIGVFTATNTAGSWGSPSNVSVSSYPTNKPLFVHYSMAGSQSTNDGVATKMVWDTVDTDKLNKMSSGTYTIPKKAIYNIEAAVQVESASFSANTTLKLMIYYNGSELRSVYKRIPTTATLNYFLNIALTYPLNAGDTIEIYVSQNEATTRNFGGSSILNFISITEIGE